MTSDTNIYQRWRIGQLVSVKAGHPMEHMVGAVQKLRLGTEWIDGADAVFIAFNRDGRLSSIWIAEEACEAVRDGSSDPLEELLAARHG